MLFRLSDNSPRFEVFRLLNNELLHFIERSVPSGVFCRELFTDGAVGQACWDNAKVNNVRAANDLTRDKFEKLYTSLQEVDESIRLQLGDVFKNNQNMPSFFANPQRDQLDFLPTNCHTTLINIATHLYCATKDIQHIIAAAGGVDITAHFNLFRAEDCNGNICKACGMEKLAAFRAGVPHGNQWRADYDHQLCKSKYPIYAVHPDNLIPLCDVCNQDAKKAENLFRHKNGTDRLAFYPPAEEARELVDIEIINLHDPEPAFNVVWKTEDPIDLDKLRTWDEIYLIRQRVEGQFTSIEAILQDYINPRGLDHCKARIRDEARPVEEVTLKRQEWAFWKQKLFQKLDQIDIAPFFDKSQFVRQQALAGVDHILSGMV